MASEWREVTIGELVEIFDGPHATPPKTNDGPVFLGISNLAQGRLDLSSAKHLSEDDHRRWTRRVEPKAGDVVFSYETRLGEAARIPSDLRCCLGRRMGLLRARPGEVNDRFLLYAYLGPRFQEILRSRTVHGSTVDRIPLIDMPGFPIEVPADIEEQRAIAHILGTLDDKVELNRRMNETLEAMVRALFKSWFVDFDPVRAKAEGRDPGLVRPLADLFPARLADTELGEIPEGWVVAPFRAVLRPRMERSGDADLPEYSATMDGLFPRDSRFKKQLSRSHSQNKRIMAGDLVFGLSRRVINFGLMRAPAGAVSPVYEVFSVDATRCDPELLEQSFRVNMQSHLSILRPGAREGQPIDREFLLSKLTLIPDSRVQDGFLRVSAPFKERMRSLHDESLALAALRDALLPKLISGELRVKAADGIVQELA